MSERQREPVFSVRPPVVLWLRRPAEERKLNYAGSQKPLPTLIKEKEPLKYLWSLNSCVCVGLCVL